MMDKEKGFKLEWWHVALALFLLRLFVRLTRVLEN